jgi:hypothetical protein
MTISGTISTGSEEVFSEPFEAGSLVMHPVSMADIRMMHQKYVFNFPTVDSK